MYIQKAEIKNIRSITDFKIEFKNPAGWHVLIGDNGSGKSTIIRSIALALIETEQAKGLRQNWSEWLNKEERFGSIILELFRDSKLDDYIFPHELYAEFAKINEQVISRVFFERSNDEAILTGKLSFNKATRLLRMNTDNPIITGKIGFFSSAYGPYRRLKGGSLEWKEVFENKSLTRLAAHLSAFDEDVALTEATNWLVELFNTSTDPHFPEEQINSSKQLENIKKLINWKDGSESFLPNNTKLESVNSKGVFFKDGNDTIISINQMSDGYRSILSMTFELIRQLVRVYGSELVFKNIEKGEMFIDLPGVVLVDEIDAHLHPTWQTRIGQWFTKYFPKLQFIVTTHSPLVCRAAENGSIWRLAAPGSDEKSGEITGLDRERLIFGNVLDAYGTEVFGENVSISEEANEMLNRLSELNVKSMMGLIEDGEAEELEKLRAILPTENKVNL